MMEGEGQAEDELPKRPAALPPPRSGDFPFFSEEAASWLLRKCRERGERGPLFVQNATKWRLAAEGEGEGEGEGVRRRRRRVPRLCCVSRVALGGPVARGGMGQVLAAATVEASPRALVAKVGESLLRPRSPRLSVSLNPSGLRQLRVRCRDIYFTLCAENAPPSSLPETFA